MSYWVLMCSLNLCIPLSSQCSAASRTLSGTQLDSCLVKIKPDHFYWVPRVVFLTSTPKLQSQQVVLHSPLLMNSGFCDCGTSLFQDPVGYQRAAWAQRGNFQQERQKNVKFLTTEKGKSSRLNLRHSGPAYQNFCKTRNLRRNNSV